MGALGCEGTCYVFDTPESIGTLSTSIIKKQKAKSKKQKAKSKKQKAPDWRALFASCPVQAQGAVFGSRRLS
jgi:hypothetical protein